MAPLVFLLFVRELVAVVRVGKMGVVLVVNPRQKEDMAAAVAGMEAKDHMVAFELFGREPAANSHQLM